MTELKTHGFVLRVMEFSESSQIAHLLTPEHGNLTILARGIHRKRRPRNFSSAIEPLTSINVVLLQKGESTMAIVKELSTVQSWDMLEHDIKRLAVASLVFEVADKTVGAGDESNGVFNLVKSFMETLAQERFNPLSLGAMYLIKMVDVLGFKPMTEHCHLCKKQKPLAYFDIVHGATVCEQCGRETAHNLVRLDRGTIEIFKRILKSHYPDLANLLLSTQQAQRVLQLACNILHYQLGVSHMKSLEFMKKTAFPEIFEHRKNAG